MITLLHSWLPMILGARIPQGQKETVPAGEGASSGTTQAGVGQQASAGVQPSPKLSEISDTTYYQIDPAKPNERILGTQLKEALHRARQVDSMQSNFHKEQAARKTLEEQLQAATSELNQIKEQQRLNQRLTELGILNNPQGTKPTQQYQPRGYQEPLDEYAFNEPNQPQQPPQVNVTSPDFLKTIESIVKETVNNALKPVNEQIQGTTAEGLLRYQQEREVRDTLMRTMQQHEENQALELRNKGASESEIQRILDMDRTAVIKAREAEDLLTVTGEERQDALALANMRLNEADNLRAEVVKAMLAIELEHERSKPRQEAQTSLETGAYAEPLLENLPTDPNEVRSFKQEDIDKFKKSRLKLAQDLAAARRRIAEASGERTKI